MLVLSATTLVFTINLLSMLGFLAFMFGRLWLIALIAKESTIAAAVCFIVPFLELKFAKDHWEEAKFPATIVIAGAACLIISGLLCFIPESTSSG